MLGRLLDGRYEITQPLGAGGFGQTYIARDIRRPGNPTCVVKHLKPVSNDPQFLPTARRLFTSEAEILEQLGSHDRIPRLLAYFEEDREFYLVQDYVEGHPLTSELLPDRPWPENKVIDLLKGVLPILEFVHSRGVIHRDIKPDNILRRNYDGNLVLVDFGAVKQVTTQMLTGGANAVSPNYTVAIGTPGYMPSEQAKGQPRPSSDIYALGAIALQAITGINPQQFEYDPHTGEILWQHRAAVSPRLATVLTGMTRYHFRDRYQSAAEVLQALEQLSVPVAPTQASARSATPPVSPAQNEPQTLPPPDYTVPLSQKQTYAVPGIKPPAPPPPAPAPQPQPQPIQRFNPADLQPVPRKSDSLPWMMFGTTMAAVFFIVFGISWAVKKIPDAFSGTRGSNNTVDAVEKTDLKSCKVVLSGNLNVRSGPGTDRSVVDTVSNGTTLQLTGNQQNGWLEVKAPARGWVYNGSDFVQCSRDNQPFVLIPPKPKPTPKPSPTPATQPDKGGDLLNKARELYESGEIDKAIEQLRSVPEVSKSYDDAQKNLDTWRSTWSEAQNNYERAKRAFDQGKWDDVIAYGNSKLPNNRYWRAKLEELTNQARQSKAREEKQNQAPETPSEPSPPPSPQPSPSPSAAQPPVPRNPEIPISPNNPDNDIFPSDSEPPASDGPQSRRPAATDEARVRRPLAIGETLLKKPAAIGENRVRRATEIGENQARKSSEPGRGFLLSCNPDEEGC
ncbi:protein kinase [Oscillatoria sp. FACHB-1406]|uniref:protein kinase domain-containing protein n=1 Tax=Oscillatoria sp. FACHB-1406 TaxID=2692846 RepID=UPI001681C6D6|nr:protein kinase [Oscillatoria sp. FACHB-1406]MBD2577613.1 protein kinase [Oscillatoria sp. FACHB-1406]